MYEGQRESRVFASRRLDEASEWIFSLYPHEPRSSGTRDEGETVTRLLGLYRPPQRGERFLTSLRNIVSDSFPAFLVAFYTLWPVLLKEMLLLIQCEGVFKEDESYTPGPGESPKYRMHQLWLYDMSVECYTSQQFPTHILAAAGLRVPEIRRAGDGSTCESGWLSKPIRSGGGIAIESASKAKSSQDRYLQRFVDGTPASALFLAGENDSARSLLLGATEQLIGESWLGATGFTWCGNLGPLKLDEEPHRQVALGGETVARELSLRGLFGLDFVLTDGGPVFIELNPRYTGSTEIIERCCEFDVIPHHLTACRDGELPPAAPAVAKACAKAILFAEAPLELTAVPGCEEESGSSFADLHRPGEKIEIGSPVLTMLTAREALAKCRSALKRMAKETRSSLR